MNPIMQLVSAVKTKFTTRKPIPKDAPKDCEELKTEQALVEPTLDVTKALKYPKHVDVVRPIVQGLEFNKKGELVKAKKKSKKLAIKKPDWQLKREAIDAACLAVRTKWVGKILTLKDIEDFCKEYLWTKHQDDQERKQTWQCRVDVPESESNDLACACDYALRYLDEKCGCCKPKQLVVSAECVETMTVDEYGDDVKQVKYRALVFRIFV